MVGNIKKGQMVRGRGVQLLSFNRDKINGMM